MVTFESILAKVYDTEVVRCDPFNKDERMKLLLSHGNVLMMAAFPEAMNGHVDQKFFVFLHYFNLFILGLQSMVNFLTSYFDLYLMGMFLDHDYGCCTLSLRRQVSVFQDQLDEESHNVADFYNRFVHPKLLACVSEWHLLIAAFTEVFVSCFIVHLFFRSDRCSILLWF